MRIKICGITNYEDAKLCCDLGADALGFIFYEKSKRCVNIDEAKTIIEKLPAFISKIGVFVNEDSKKINEIAHEIKLIGIQLHGEESPEFVQQIYLPVIKAFRVNNDFGFSITDKYHGCKFMFDTHSKSEYGGTGQAFDWEIIPMNLRKSIIIAGGISASNIEFIFKTIKPEAVDVSSSLEISPGIKDESKIKSFFEIFNSLRRQQC